MTAQTPELIEHMLEDLKSPTQPLTKWEQTFFESVADQFLQRRTLSSKQFEILERIYTERTA